jgi:hypothetical protein
MMVVRSRGGGGSEMHADRRQSKLHTLCPPPPPILFASHIYTVGSLLRRGIVAMGLGWPVAIVTMLS